MLPEELRRPNRYVVAKDSMSVFSDPAYKFRQLESIRDQLRAHYPDFDARVKSTPHGDNYRFEVIVKSPDRIDDSVVAVITQNLEAQGIRVRFVDSNGREMRGCVDGWPGSRRSSD